MELVILAAGMGSRFGGLKQIEPMDDYGNFIIDYSIYDAIEAGFDSVVFIIKEEHYDDFKDTIGRRIEGKINVKYAFQKLNDLPEGYKCPEGRTKPYGTAHAILSARNVIKDSFIIINADDFYGKESYKVAASFLKSVKPGEKGKYANVLYGAANTLAENGSVKRGVCYTDENGNFKEMTESSIVRNDKGVIEATPLDETLPMREIPDSMPVSMNMFCFTRDIIDEIEAGFPKFLDDNKNNPLKCEYLIPSVASDLVKEGKATLTLLSTPSKWYGMTYREDKQMVVDNLKKLTDEGKYKKGLWK